MAGGIYTKGQKTMKKPDPAVPFQDTLELRNEIIACGLHLRDKLGYFISSWGNISVRVEKGMLVTPSRVEYHMIVPEDLVLLSWEGKRLAGSRVPTSECEMHRRLMLERSDVGVWIHHHGPWSSVLAGAGKSLPVVADDMAELVGGEVHCAPHVIAGKHVELACAVQKAIGPDSWAVLLANHGVVCGGRTINEAVACCQVVEKSAMMFLLGTLFGGVQTIEESLWQEERERYLFRYGKPEDLKGVLNK
jgi:L-fuculose-phosphate aldolase